MIGAQRASTRPILVVGVAGPRDLMPSTGDHLRQRLLGEADLVVGSGEHLEAAEHLVNDHCRMVRLGNPGLSLTDALDLIAEEPGGTVVLASGDPGFFGVVRSLAERFGSSSLQVHPAPSSVSRAFARLGMPWDDAAVVSAHGRPLWPACCMASRFDKVALLLSPEHAPDQVAGLLEKAGASHAKAAWVSALDSDSEQVTVTTLEGLASQSASKGPSLLLLWSHNGIPTRPSYKWPPAPSARTEWGLPTDRYAHRDSMITKPEVRASAIARLALVPGGCLWDIGAGSGSLSIEAARIFPTMSVVAVERDAEAFRLLCSNAQTHAVALETVHGDIVDCIDELPPPDSVFIGGGGLPVLRLLIDRLSSSIRLVATYSALDRAVEAGRLLGEMAEISVSRAVSLPDGGVRLAAENPVFIAWGDT
jgi:precorrin-6Y C5,15-methyltransferase (decarboxylating)